jgi:hypothetical protein
MAEGLRLEDWIGKLVAVKLHRGPAAVPGDETVEILGFLEGVDLWGLSCSLALKTWPESKAGQPRPPICLPATSSIRGGASSSSSAARIASRPRTKDPRPAYSPDVREYTCSEAFIQHSPGPPPTSVPATPIGRGLRHDGSWSIGPGQ